MSTTLFVVGGVIQTRGRHVRGTNGLDLLQLPVFLFTDDLTCKEIIFQFISLIFLYKVALNKDQIYDEL